MSFNKDRLDKALSVVFAIFLVLLIITFSIGLPIYFRPFYFWQIDSLDIVKYTGESKEAIKDSYNELMDYLTLGKEFGTGVFKYSESGKSHFVDCKVLFDLNATVLVLSLAVCATIIILARLKKISLWRPHGFFMPFFSGIATLLVFLIIGSLAALDFDRAFTIFHTLFFPGKTNWYFDPWKDEIILALPQEFFMNAAILIFSSIILLCTACIVFGIIIKKRSEKN